MIIAIESNGETLALAEGDDVVTRLNTDRLLRDTVRQLKRNNVPLWDGVSDFTSRPATETESAVYAGRVQ